MATGWQAYIQNLHDSSKCIQKSAIIGANDGNLWAKSEAPLGQDFKPSDVELKKIISQFNNIKNVPCDGCIVEGVKYIVPWTEDNIIFGKRDKSGLFAVKTNLAVVIALFNGDNSECVSTRQSVERLAQYLRDQGY